MATSGTPSRLLVLLVHGTFADDDSEEGTRWWQRGGDFERWLSRALSADEPDAEVHVFRWSGLNTETARRRAGRDLGARLLEYEVSGRRYAVVAHSHGGGVLWHALVDVSRSVPGLPNLAQCIAVGTPFLTFRPDWSSVMYLVPLVVGIAGLVTIGRGIGANVRASLFDLIQYPDPLSTIVLPFLIGVMLVFALTQAVRLWRGAANALRERRDARAQLACARAVGERFLAIYATADEAINALAGTLGPAAPMVPRFAGVFAGIYNSFAAVAGDQFIWEQLSRKSHGNDLIGMRLAQVSVHPSGVPAAVLLSPSSEQQLSAAAAATAPSILLYLRRWLAGLVRQDLTVGFTAGRAALPGASDALIHTRYFESADVRQMIGGALTRQRGGIESGPASSFLVRARRPPYFLRVCQASLMVLVTASLWTLTAPLLARVDAEALLQARMIATPVFEGMWRNAEQPSAYIRQMVTSLSVAEASRLIADSGRAPWPAAFIAEIALGLDDAGRHDEAANALSLAATMVTSPNLPPGVSGPVEPLSRDARAVLYALSRSKRLDEVDRLMRTLIEQAGDTTHFVGSNVLGEVVRGLADAGDFEAAVARLRDIRHPSTQYDAFMSVLAHLPDERVVASAVSSLAEEERAVARATVADAYAHTWSSQRMLEYLGPIEEAGLRSLGAASVATALEREGHRDRALTFLREELDQLTSRPRDWVHGTGEILTRFAAAFFDLESRSEAEDLLHLAGSIGPERRDDDSVAADDSGPDRARLWARLGRVDLAFRHARETYGNDRLPLLREVASLSTTASGPEVVQDAARAFPDPLDQLYGLLGTVEGSLGRGSTRARYHAIDGLVARAAALPNPLDRSSALRDTALLWLQVGNIRRAMLVSDACDPNDRLKILAPVLALRRVSGAGSATVGLTESSSSLWTMPFRRYSHALGARE